MGGLDLQAAIRAGVEDSYLYKLGYTAQEIERAKQLNANKAEEEYTLEVKELKEGQPSQGKAPPPPPPPSRYIPETYHPMMPPYDDIPQKTRGAGIFSGGLTNILLMVAVSAAIAYLLVGQFAPSIKQYKADITRLENDLVKMRADYALKSDVSSVPTFNNRITTLESSLNQAKNDIANDIKQLSDLQAWKTQASTTMSALQSQVAGIKTFDPTSLQTQITQHSATIATLTSDLAALKTQVGSIKPTDLAAINTKITALEASVASLTTSVTTLTAQIAAIQPVGIVVTGITSSLFGYTAAVYSSFNTPAVLSITYTFVTPLTVTDPYTSPALTGGVLPYLLSTVVDTYGTSTKVSRITWNARVILTTATNNIQWTPPPGLAAGVWSASVEVGQ